MQIKKIPLLLMMLGLSSLSWADFKIQDIRVEGLQHTEPATVFTYLPVKIGDNFSPAQSEGIIKNLYATGWFDDVKVETMGNQILLTVIERPIISTLNITGGQSLQNSAIKKNLQMMGLAESQPFNPAKLNDAIAALQTEYHNNQGKNQVKITPTVTKLARNRVDIDLKIEEGKTTTIRDIEFEGNEKFSNYSLRRQMDLSETGMFTWLTRANRFSADKFTADLTRITELYQDNGYYDFRINDTDIQTDEKTAKQTIKISLSEGQRYRWGKVTLDGDTREIPKTELQELLTMKEGKWYNRSKLVDALQKIRNRLGKAGYAYAETSVIPQPHTDTGIIDFVLVVNPGRKVYVNKINISGNNKTRDEVIRRELRQMEAAPYDSAKIQRSQERVNLLGYFDNVNFDAKPVPNTADQVDLDVTLSERNTGSLDLSAGWVQGTGLVLSAGIAQDNLFGTGKSVSARVTRSNTTLGASLSFTDPYFTQEGVSMGYDLYGRRYDPTKDSSDAQQYKTTKYGLGVRMGVPVTEYDRVNFGLNAEHMKLNIFNGAPMQYSNFIRQYGTFTSADGAGYFTGWIPKASIGWGRNTTDSAIWPTRGYLINANAEMSVPGSSLQFYSLTHDQRWFFPLSQDFTLMLGGQIGWANGYGKTKELPFFQNFYGGGLGSVRGYETSTLGPKVIDSNGDKISYGGNKMFSASAELLFPFPGMKRNSSVRMSLFADAGSVWDNKTYTPYNSNGAYTTTHESTLRNEMRYSAGVALTWISPVGPLKFSYAYPIKKKPSDEIQRFQFQLGTTF